LISGQRWNGGVGAVALIVCLLGAASLAAAAGPYPFTYMDSYEGYGPVEKQLDVNDPPIPEPIGPRLLRNIPGVAEQMRSWNPFFRDIDLDLHLRSYYLNQEIPLRPKPSFGPDSVTREAWALGGWLTLNSGWFMDTFRMGATAYTSQPAYAPDSRDGTGLLGPDQTSLTVPGQAFGQLRYQNYALLTGYRQLVNQGFVNPQDNRMIPNTFEGATLAGSFGPVDYYVGYLTAMKTRISEHFVNMAEVAGAVNHNRGMFLTTLNFEAARGGPTLAPLAGFDVFVGNYYVPDLFNTVWVNPEYRRALSENWRFMAGVQYWNQTSVGDNLIGGFTTWQVGSRFEIGWKGLTFLAMMSATGSEVGVRSPYGGWRGYISLLATDFNLANEKAWEVGFTHDWNNPVVPALHIPGLWTSLLFAQGLDVKAQRQQTGVANRNELDLLNVWRPLRVPGFQFRFLSSYIKDDDKARSFYDFRIIMDWEIPLF